MVIDDFGNARHRLISVSETGAALRTYGSVILSLYDALEFESRKYNKCMSFNDALEFESRKYNKCLSFNDAREFEFKIW